MIIGFKETNPRTYTWETNDCVVRASTVALQLPYDVVHARFKAAGRKDKRGTLVPIIDDVLGDEGGRNILKYSRYNAPTLAQFVKLRGRGRWVVCNSRHAFALIDGAVHDAGQVGARVRIRCAWKVGE